MQAHCLRAVGVVAVVVGAGQTFLVSNILFNVLLGYSMG